MKQPQRRGTIIDMKRIAKWAREYNGYRHSVDSTHINRFLEQFTATDKDIIARLLDSIEFISVGHINHAFRSILDGLEGWHIEPKKRKGIWRFVAFSGSAGESGDSMLHNFRIANNLDKKIYNELFIARRDLLISKLGADDSLVFVDDFSGTGQQAYEAWKDTFCELLPGEPNIYLVLVRACIKARIRINSETSMRVRPYMEMMDSDNIFSSKCRHFNSQERKTILKYCLKADKRNPKGRGECGLILVFAHRCPNNSIPILHVNNRKWNGLFPRHG